LVANVKGLGWKEASHFLRNVGFTDVAIIDFHILDLLARFQLVKRKPKALNKKRILKSKKAASARQENGHEFGGTRPLLVVHGNRQAAQIVFFKRAMSLQPMSVR